jgi:signal transduction histidine kinase
MKETIKVLIVDDSKLIRMTIRDLLNTHFTPQEMQIEMAEDGDQALALFGTYEPNIILLDIMMPKVDGIEVLMHLQERILKGEVQTIMITGMGDDQTLSKCFDLGASDFISKPIQDVALTSRLKGAIRQHHLIQSLNRLNQELTLAKNQMVQAEKMAAVGQLAAGIAHEINNPVGYISSNIHTLKKYYQNWKSGKNQHIFDLDTDIQEIFEDLDFGVDRIKEIVDSLRSFSRIDNISEINQFDVEQGIRDTLNVARHRYKYIADVQIEFGNVPLIYANGGKINQVFLNILINAADAIKSAQGEDGRTGQISIETKYISQDETVEIKFVDNGTGMDEETLQRLYNPFFTTKPVGSGTGLGMSLSYDIVVHEHKGKIMAKSELGNGTEFTVLLPVGKA